VEQGPRDGELRSGSGQESEKGEGGTKQADVAEETPPLGPRCAASEKVQKGWKRSVVGMTNAASISAPTSGQMPNAIDRMASTSQRPTGQPAT